MHDSYGNIDSANTILKLDIFMTCIVGITNGDEVYIGGDRGVSDAESIFSMSRPKVHIKNGWIFGYAGNIGTGQLLEFIDFPILGEDDDPYKVLRLDIIEELKRHIELYGALESDGVDILIGIKGRLFEVSSDGWGVIEVDHCSIGSGNTYALGSLYTSRYYEELPIESRIYMAVNAAITYSPTCQAPVDILHI